VDAVFGEGLAGIVMEGNTAALAVRKGKLVFGGDVDAP
jgi:hypothetical protein